MASGKDLKRRITSVKSTQQITKAMKMVSAARLRRAQEAITRARPFAVGISELVENLVGGDEIREFHALLTKREVKKVNVVLITSDRGLCGGFNSALLKRAETLYKKDANNYEKFDFTCIGKKGNEYLTLRKIPVANYLQDFQKGLNYAKVQVLAEELMKSYLKGEYDEIRIIFSEFKSAMVQIPQVHTLLPISMNSGDGAKTTKEFLYEPSKESVLEEVLPRYFKAMLNRALLESIASEHGARMAAMESATKNAGEMIKKLTLEYNKIRQAGITKELLEIVSGAEALK